jgi:hypothetical protein
MLTSLCVGMEEILACQVRIVGGGDYGAGRRVLEIWQRMAYAKLERGI